VISPDARDSISQDTRGHGEGKIRQNKRIKNMGGEE
jgi:hypothetical protein